MNRPEYNRKINALARDISRYQELIDMSQEKLEFTKDKMVETLRTGWDE